MKATDIDYLLEWFGDDMPLVLRNKLRCAYEAMVCQAEYEHWREERE